MKMILTLISFISVTGYAQECTEKVYHIVFNHHDAKYAIAELSKKQIKYHGKVGYRKELESYTALATDEGGATLYTLFVDPTKDCSSVLFKAIKHYY